jgi:phenylalanyl-tRNA synthetase beta chain
VPRAILSAARLLEGLDPVPPRAELEETLFLSKVELESWEGDALTISVTPDRLDLLSETGLRAYLDGALGRSGGLPVIHDYTLAPGEFLEATAKVAPLRSEIAGLVVHAPVGSALDAGLLEEAVRFQELLHATVGYDRRLASLGIYPASAIKFPLKYDREPVEGLEFVPLEAEEPVPAGRFFAEHPLAARYGAFGLEGGECLTLRDSHGTVLSLPPVLNSGVAGRVRPGDRRLLLESTGTRRARVEEALALLAMPFLLRGWSAAPLRVKAADRVHHGESLLAPRQLSLPDELLGVLSGYDLPPEEVEPLLGRARYAVRRSSDGFLVAAPPWRADLLGPVDVAEDVLLLRGVRTDEGRIPPSSTVGRRRPESRFRARVGTYLLGLGFTALHTPLLTSEAMIERLGRSDALALVHPVSAELSRARDSLQPSLVSALAHNLRHGYPQRLSEVGPVLVRDAAAESGARTREHAGFLVAGEAAGFADGAAVLDYLLRRLSVIGVREPAEIPGTLPGRAARILLAGEAIAEFGELHPAVLAATGVVVPAVWGELDLDAIYPLLGPAIDPARESPSRAGAASP